MEIRLWEALGKKGPQGSRKGITIYAIPSSQNQYFLKHLYLGPHQESFSTQDKGVCCQGQIPHLCITCIPIPGLNVSKDRQLKTSQYEKNKCGLFIIDGRDK